MGRVAPARKAERDEPDRQRGDVEVLLELDADDDCGVLVLTGAGEGLRAAPPTIMALATGLADHLDCDSDDDLPVAA